MKKITIIILAVTVVVIAALIFAGLLMIRGTKENVTETIPTGAIPDTKSSLDKHEDIIIEDDVYIDETPEQEIPQTISPTPRPTITPQKDTASIAEITIQTDRKTRTYDVMPNVDENTLKKNIGYLPSSAWFGEEGLCVLMGHRDTDFSILQYVEIDDVILVETDENQYRYSVVNIEIIDSDNKLRFEILTGSYLVLVTCYPFRYNGHAPKKYIIYAIN